MKQKISKFITLQHYTALLATATFGMALFIFLGIIQDIKILKNDGKTTLIRVVKIETKIENIEKNIDSEKLNGLIKKITENEKRYIQR